MTAIVKATISTLIAFSVFAIALPHRDSFIWSALIVIDMAVVWFIFWDYFSVRETVRQMGRR